jgi:NAD(P)-dependent dehydrogenase (short-subunit alcohol dehydrogenase family)
MLTVPLLGTGMPMVETPIKHVAVVTGGSAGIGRATVRAFAEAGYDVAVLARGRAGLDGALQDIRGCGRRGLAVQTDVADVAAVEAATDQVEAELGPIDVWVNCAFVGSLAYFWDTTVQEYERMTAVTYGGQVNGVRAALRVMRPRDRGVIINVSSALAHRGIPLQSAYCGAKHAVKGFTESVMTELAATGSSVRIGLVTLPGVNTPQFDWNLNRMDGHPMPVAPIYEPEVCAAMIVDLARRPRRNAWISIATAYTVLGNRIAPGFVDWYLSRTGVTSQQTDQDAPRYADNLFTPQDEAVDRGARGAFSEQARSRDPLSLLSATVGRQVGKVFGAGLSALDAALDLLP